MKSKAAQALAKKRWAKPDARSPEKLPGRPAVQCTPLPMRIDDRQAGQNPLPSLLMIAATVTEDHVDRQYKADGVACLACAIALAINEMLAPGTMTYAVASGFILVEHGVFVWHQWFDDRTCLLIELVDGGCQVELPHTFTTDISRKYLKD
jgi:hypothetical protein